MKKKKAVKKTKKNKLQGIKRIVILEFDNRIIGGKTVNFLDIKSDDMKK